MLSRCIVFLIFLLVANSGLAQGGTNSAAKATVEVENVDFQRVRDLSGATWWEASVELRISPRPGAAGKFADRVQVGFNFAHQSPLDPAQLQFYRASVTAASLEVGRFVFRFYLPPAIVARDRITGGARFWTVDVNIDGVAQPPNREQVSDQFSSAEAVANFRQQLAGRAAVNDGIMLPRHLLPAGAFPGFDPAVIRREAAEGRR